MFITIPQRDDRKEKAMTLAQPLQVGDRVRTIRKANGLAKGMEGTVVRVLPNTDCYDVRFDSYSWFRLVYRGDLQRVEQEMAVGQA